jgi:hypothetical protein
LAHLPRVLLRLEGAAVFGVAVTLYFHEGYGWLALLLLALAPDLSMIGFAAGNAVGAAAYDAAHTYVLPLALGLAAYLADAQLPLQVALVWLAHIGVDRLVGYGLKYPSDFKDTHLQRV